MKKILCCLGLLSFINVAAQVGVNTSLPLAPFHIDGKKDNPVNGVSSQEQVKNDLVVDTEGRLGLGTVTPTAKLDVRGDSNFSGPVGIGGVLDIHKEIKLDGLSGDEGAYFVSQGEGVSPTWHNSVSTDVGNIEKAGGYSFSMLDDTGKSVMINVDNLFNKYLKSLNIPSVGFYGVLAQDISLNAGLNLVKGFVNQLPKSKTVEWESTSGCIVIKEAGMYLFSMQLGVNVLKGNTPTGDIILGFSEGPPAGANTNWVGRGVFRVTPSEVNLQRGISTYNVLLNLKQGDRVYPVVNSTYGKDQLLIYAKQSGTTGTGVLTNLVVTKY